MQSSYPGWTTIDTRVLGIGCAVDQDSLFWLCTNRGLMRVDKRTGGQTLIRPMEHGRGDDLIQSLAADGRGGVWLGMGMGGLAHFDGTEWKSVPLPASPGFILRQVRVAVDAAGRLWVHGSDAGASGNISPGLFILENGSWKILSADGMPEPPGPNPLDRSPWAMSLDTAGHAWVVSRAGLYEYGDSGWSWRGKVPEDIYSITDLVVSPDGGKWALSSEKYADRVYLFREGPGWAIIDTPGGGGSSPSTVFSICLGPEGEVWMDGTSGLTRVYGADSKHFDVFGKPFASAKGTGIYLAEAWSVNSFKDARIDTSYSLVPLRGEVRAIAFDGERGGPMLATGSGPALLDHDRWSYLPDPPVNPDTSRFHYGYKASILAYDRQGHAWLGDDDGAFKWKDTAWSLTPLQERTSTFAFGLDGTIWTGSKGAPFVYRLDSSGVTVFNGANSPVNGWIYGLLVDKSGTVWAADDSGMHAYDGKSWISFPSVANHRIYAMAQDSSGVLWGCGGGLWRIRGNDVEEVPVPSELESDLFTNLAIDGSGDIWLAPYAKGLWQFNGSRWQSYTTRNSGLLSDTVSCFAIHPSGDLWIGSTRGLTVMNIPIAAPILLKRSKPDLIRISSRPDGIRYTLTSDSELRYFITDGLGRLLAEGRLGQKSGDHFLPVPVMHSPAFIRISTSDASRTLRLGPGRSR